MNIKEAVEQLDHFCKEVGWNGREFKTGRNYRISGKTAVSIYSSGTDKLGTIEVAFETNTIAHLADKTSQEVNAWIKNLQNSVGSYAKPKTQYQYPRVALSTNQEIQNFISAAQGYLHNEAQRPNRGAHEQEPDRTPEPVTDQRVLSSILSRRGQPKFRQALLDAYNGVCAISGCDNIPVLEAAHIIPHSEQPSYATSSGILLRADIHTLFDLFLVSIDPEHGSVVMSNECKPAYEQFDGVVVNVPRKLAEQPDPALLMRHFQKWKQRNHS